MPCVAARESDRLAGGASMAVFLWTQIQDIWPSARASRCAAYNSIRERTVLFGGISGLRFGDTWELVDNQWTQVQDTGPAPRSGCAMVFDAARHHVVLFGGQSDDVLLDDTWRWDGHYWTQVADTGPTPRSNHAIAELASVSLTG
jgi:hypothetical protein